MINWLLVEKYTAKQNSYIQKVNIIRSNFMILLEENPNTAYFNCTRLQAKRFLCTSVFVFIVLFCW